MKAEFINFMKAMDIDEFNTIRNSDLGEKLSYINIVHLYIINHYDKITVSDLAKKLNLSKPAVTQKINELEKLGMVIKTQSKEDKRVYYISLSKDVMASCNEPKMGTVIDAVDKHFSKEKKEVFREILEFMTAYVIGDENND
ncbi:MAG: MarR family transcriptional regulator [Peptostreptococcaceae bacterium]